MIFEVDQLFIVDQHVIYMYNYFTIWNSTSIYLWATLYFTHHNTVKTIKQYDIETATKQHFQLKATSLLSLE